MTLNINRETVIVRENCRKIGVDPHEYLLDVLTRLPSMKITEIDRLIPANWLAEKQAQAA